MISNQNHATEVCALSLSLQSFNVILMSTSKSAVSGQSICLIQKLTKKHVGRREIKRMGHRKKKNTEQRVQSMVVKEG